MKPEDQQQALVLARSVLEHHVRKQALPVLDELGILITPAFQELRGVFITLFQEPAPFSKILRGCIGTILAQCPLYEGIIMHTVNAASRDRRFLPVREEELAGLVIEINVLSLPYGIDSYHRIDLGKDGIILSQGPHQAVFLPSVPIEWHWTLEETLGHLSKKAGLSEDAWQNSSTQFQVFQSESFSEKTRRNELLF
jgi:AmmeMemoRadiSam system protein A